MSARIYFMKTVNGCKDVSVMSLQTVKTDKFTLFVYCNFLVLLSINRVCSQNLKKQMVNIADENLYFFWNSNGPIKNPLTFFSLKIKSLEKQKCVNKLFLSKSKILKRFNHRTPENLQNCNKKTPNFQFWYNFYGKIVFQWFLRFQLNSVYLIL